MRYLIKISYDGSKFNGFQRLNKLNTVQREIERALSIINKKDTVCKGASRTDKGVHALSQMVHFDLDYDIPCDRLINALNDILVRYVRVLECNKVDDEFHARFNVISKKYVYKIYLGDNDPFMEDYYLEFPYKLDMNLLKKSAKLFIGKHNFKNFVSGERDNYDMYVQDIKIITNNKFIEIEFFGKSFYRYMVRNMVGAMLDVARGNRNIDELNEMINNPSSGIQMATAPSNGLYLVDIKY